MNKLKMQYLEISEITIEELLYQYNIEKQIFFLSRQKSKGIHKIIFITNYFNKDLEQFSIQCIQKNIQILVLFENRILNQPESFWEFINDREKNLIIFSKHCQKSKQLLSKYINFDPIRDDIFDTIESPIDKAPEFLIKNPTIKNKISQQFEEPKNEFLVSFEKPTEPKDNISTILIKEDKKNVEHINNIHTQKEEQILEQEQIIHHKKQEIKKPQEETILKESIQNFKEKDSQIQKVKITIRTKLMGITGLLITTALSMMIFAASYFFKRDIETQIQTNNANIVNIISQKIEDLIRQIYFDSELIIKTYNNKNQTIMNLESFENPYIFCIAIVKIENKDLSIEKWYYNESLMQQNALISDDFEKVIPSYKETIITSESGLFNLLNISPNFNIPILLMSAPTTVQPNKIILVFINGQKLINDFPSEENSKTFMVNRKGDILTFPDLELVQSAANISDMPIVKMMLESKIDNGLTNFTYNSIEYLGAYKKISLGGIGILKITEAKKAFEPVFTTQRRNLYILGIVLIIGIIIIYFFSKTISQPVKELALATEKVEQEDYSVRVLPKTKDEIGLLAHSFNQMVKGLEERERMKDAFGRFVNKEIAEKALRGEIKLGGEKKECAIFFSDLRGFTAMSEKMKPEEVVEYLNRYFTLMVDCVEKTHGIVDKFIGDAIMATWGAVTSYGNDTENAINGALLMRKKLIEFNQYNKQHNLPIAKFGCGINTGEVISGQIGSEKRLEFTVIGDAVNLASRIEALNKPFATDILISQDSYERVKDIFNVVKMPAIKVKGKKEPQTIYCVLGRKDDPDCPKSLEELRKLVGIDWKPQIKEDQQTLEEDKEEKYEILQ